MQSEQSYLQHRKNPEEVINNHGWCLMYVCFVIAIFKGLFFQQWRFKQSYGTAIYLTTVPDNTEFLIVLIVQIL